MGETPARLASSSHAEHDLRELRPLLVADDVNEVVINPDGVVWAERADAEHMVKTGHRFPPGKVLQLSKHLAGETMNRLGPLDISNDRQPACAFWLTPTGGMGPASIRITVPPASSLW